MNVFSAVRFITAVALLFSIISCSDTKETPVTTLDITDKHHTPFATTKIPPPAAVSAAPQAPSPPPTVIQVTYYADRQLTQPLTGAVPHGVTIYTKVVFSEPMRHHVSDRADAYPILHYVINGKQRRYDIVAHDASTDTFQSGDSKPTQENATTFICKYTVRPEDEGTFTLKVGKSSVDATGVPFAAAYVHPTQLSLNDDPGELILSPTTIAENKRPGMVVGKLSHLHWEEPTYKIADTQAAQFFWIDKAQNVRARVSFNYEVRDTYVLPIEGKDGATQEQARHEFKIRILDANDPHDFSLSNTEVPENSPVGHKVADILITDEDVNENYRFIVITDSRQYLIESDRTVVLRAVPNHEDSNGMDTLEIRIIGATNNSVDKTFVITKLDENEPPIDIALTSTEFARDAVVGDLIGEVLISDPDRDDAHQIEIIEGEEWVVFRHGYLELAKLFDTPSKEIVIEVTDRGGLKYRERFVIKMEEEESSGGQTPVSQPAPVIIPEEAPETTQEITPVEEEEEDVPDA